MKTLSYRIDLPSLLGDGNIIGIELGVAKGDFSLELLKRYPNLTLWSVDRWSDHHDDAEYQWCKTRLQKFGDRSRILRNTFDEALEIAAVDNAVFDFIYIDGYAHTGQEGGKTLRDWYPRLAPEGLFSGHDYHERWPLTVKAVDEFAQSVNREIGTTPRDQFPSWYLK